MRWNASCARYQCMINFARKLRMSALWWCKSFSKPKVLWKMKISRMERTFEAFWRQVFNTKFYCTNLEYQLFSLHQMRSVNESFLRKLFGSILPRGKGFRDLRTMPDRRGRGGVGIPILAGAPWWMVPEVNKQKRNSIKKCPKSVWVFIPLAIHFLLFHFALIPFFRRLLYSRPFSLRVKFIILLLHVVFCEQVEHTHSNGSHAWVKSVSFAAFHR